MTTILRFNIFKFSWINNIVKIKSAPSNDKVSGKDKLSGYHNLISILSTHVNDSNLVLKKYIQTYTLKNWKLKHYSINSTDRTISEDKCLQVTLHIPG
jgi:hypothetical protein